MTVSLKRSDPRLASPASVRELARSGEWDGHTAGVAEGYAQANLVVLPREDAFDFLVFCTRNPKPCPLLDVTEVGSPRPAVVAPDADLRTDLPRYRIYRRGELVEETTDITDYWRQDMVGFLLGCSYTFEGALLEAGVPLRHIEQGTIVPMFRSGVACASAGRFHGPMVVSMRPVPAALVPRAVQVTARYPAVHGAPVHVGDPASLGVADINSPDWGDPAAVQPGDVPVFWACGVTPQAAAMASRPELMITHAPGHMFVTDVPIARLAVG